MSGNDSRSSMPLMIYLSARYESREQMKEYSKFLAGYGYEMMDQWIQDDQMDFSGMDNIPTYPGETYAWEDYFDLKSADVMIAFTEKQDQPKGRGGRHVEFGMAWVMGKPIIIVGPNENVFHAVEAKDVWRLPEWDGQIILEFLAEIEDFLYMNKPRRV